MRKDSAHTRPSRRSHALDTRAVAQTSRSPASRGHQAAGAAPQSHLLLCNVVRRHCLSSHLGTWGPCVLTLG